MVSLSRIQGHKKVRIFAGALLIFSLWVLPFSTIETQTITVGLLCFAGIFLGLHTHTDQKFFYSLVVCVALALFTPVVYLSDKLSVIAWLLVAWISYKLGATLRANPLALTWVLGALFFSAIINCLEGFLQYFGLADAIFPWVPDALYRGVAVGALRQRNLLATFLCCGVICTVWLLQLKKISRSLAWLSLLVLGFGIAATNSRVGTLEATSLAIAAVLLRKKIEPSTLWYLGGVLVIIFLASFVLPVLTSLHGFDVVLLGQKFTDSGRDVRFALWGNVIDMIAVHPWVGWGWNELKYAHYVTLFDADKVSFGGLLGNAHNLILHLAVTLGIPIATVFTAFTVWGSYQAVRVSGLTGSAPILVTQDRPYWALAILMVIGIHSLLEFPLWHAGFMSLTGMAIGYLTPPTLPRQSKALSLGINSFTYTCTIGLVVACILVWQQHAMMLKANRVGFGMIEAQKIALAEASGAWFFQDQLDLMGVVLNKPTSLNTHASRANAERALHYSPTPVVIESLLASLILIEDSHALKFHAIRYCNAFPKEYLRWFNENASDLVSMSTDLKASCRH